MKWTRTEPQTHLPIKSWCDPLDDIAWKQAIQLASHPALAHHVALMPDCHPGAGMPIGGVIAARNALLPNAVGKDIGCGMVAVQTDLPAEKLQDMTTRQKLMDAIAARIPLGEGNAHKTCQEWDGFQEYLDTNGQVSNFGCDFDKKNLGTLGGGNHFIEIQKSDDGYVWLMIHSGSRNLGKRIADFYDAKALKLNQRFFVNLPSPDLAFLPIADPAGHDYFRDMQFALKYAQENRRRMMTAVKECLADLCPQTGFLQEINIHHNYASFEKHFGETLCIHRKGATSAKLGELGIIPGSMGTASYIVKGLGNTESFMSCSHGAGRRLGRIAACCTLNEEDCERDMEGILHTPWKPYHKGGPAHGKLDLSEAPKAYKPIDQVIDAQTDLVTPMVRLTPLAVLKG